MLHRDLEQDLRVFRLRGKVLLELGRKAEASAAFERWLSLQRGHPDQARIERIVKKLRAGG